MTVEILIYPGLVFIGATTAARLIERERDVLYGPYIQGRRQSRTTLRDLLDEIMISSNLRREYSRLAVKFASVSLFASAIIGVSR
jgi:hypothetical protein